MKTTSSLTAFVLAGATALALAVPSLAPRLVDRFAPSPAPVAGATLPDLGPVWPDTGWPDLGSSGSSGTSASGSSGTSGAGTSGAGASGSGASASGSTRAVTAQQSQGIVLIAAQTSGGEAAGTGMVLTSDGQVLTNYHVVEGSTRLQATVASTGEVYRATVVGHDASKDVALLQLDRATGLATITPDADRVALGQPLTAVGNASGGGELVAATGTVTGLDQQVTVDDDFGGTETLTGVIETDAGAVPGDSGGPMFDAQGEVLGMTTAGSQRVTRGPRGTRATTTTTTSYAVPIADALAVVQQIRTGRESGTVQVGAKAYLGISVAQASSLVVASVEAGGPAAAAGLDAGAQITSLGGTAVSTHAGLSAVLAQLDPGAKAKLTWVDASGAAHSAIVTLGSSPVN